MSIKPLKDKILVQLVEKEQVVTNGIVLPGTVQENVQEAKVIAVGIGLLTNDGTISPLEVYRGDLVLIRKGFGVEMNDNGEKYLMITEQDVYGIKK